MKRAYVGSKSKHPGELQSIEGQGQLTVRPPGAGEGPHFGGGAHHVGARGDQFEDLPRGLEMRCR